MVSQYVPKKETQAHHLFRTGESGWCPGMGDVLLWPWKNHERTHLWNVQDDKKARQRLKVGGSYQDATPKFIYLLDCAGSYLWNVGLQSLRHVGSSSVTGDGTQASYNGSAESQPLDCEGSPYSMSLTPSPRWLAKVQQRKHINIRQKALKTLI